jgi:hypothetical protein
MRRHRGWFIAGGVVAAWVVCELITGSFFSATVLLLSIAVFGAIAFAFCRHMGYTWPSRRGYRQEPSPEAYSYAPPFDAFAAPQRPVPERPAEQAPPPVNNGWVWREEASGLTVAEPNPSGSSMPTISEAMLIPHLRLVTNGSRSETSHSGARAGRGDVELKLPDVPTISREHAKVRFDSGKWWITNLGLNGILLNGAPVEVERSLSNGDTIRWGSRPEALESRVEIG